jgi:hypothetical protein
MKGSDGCVYVKFRITQNNKMFRGLDLFPSSGEAVGTRTLMGPLDWMILRHWITVEINNQRILNDVK